jgi:glycerol-3-phosphate O-acyltransferase
MLRLLRLFWRRFYAGVDIHHIQPIKQIALTHQLVYVPCHRSHVDYLLLSYVIFTENLAIPYIAAGNNLNLPFIGRILRGGGAFFIRRSFKGNPLYSAVMKAYVERLIDMGVPMEYFIEGGRSRTGRMLKPKLGMLKMTVDAYVKSQSKPLAFVPVYIGYEKLIEGRSYLGELYGEKKQKESLFGALRSIFKLKGNFGRVTTSFGKPIIISEILDRHVPDWRIDNNAEATLAEKAYRTAIENLGMQIMYRINRATVVNPVNMIATILLATPRQTIDSNELVEQSAFYVRLIQSNPVLQTITLANQVDEAQIERIAAQKLLHIARHELGDIVYLKPAEAILMSYYRNNSLHVFIIPALIACCFVNTRMLTRDKLMHTIAFIYPFLKSELQLEWDEQDLDDSIHHALTSMLSETILSETKTGLKRPDRSDNQFTQLIRLAYIIQPILERYYMTFIVLWQSAEAPMQIDALEQRCYLLAQKISMIYGINSPDFFDRLLFNDFIKTMLRLDYLEQNNAKQLIFTRAFNYVDVDIRNLLGSEVRGTILNLVKKQN